MGAVSGIAHLRGISLYFHNDGARRKISKSKVGKRWKALPDVCMKKNRCLLTASRYSVKIGNDDHISPRMRTDACVVIKLFLVEEHTETVRAYFAQLLDISPTINVNVPDLLFVECANILWKQVRRSEYSYTQALQDLIYLNKMHLPATSTSELIAQALGIAYTYGTSAYDACYVALADRQ